MSNPYPFQSGDDTVLGPECFKSGDVICYQGQNYRLMDQTEAIQATPHTVQLTFVEQGYSVWKFKCHHDMNDPKWCQSDVPHPGYCWLQDYWSNIGSELLDLGDKDNWIHLPEIPIKPSHPGGEEVTFILDKET